MEQTTQTDRPAGKYIYCDNNGLRVDALTVGHTLRGMHDVTGYSYDVKVHRAWTRLKFQQGPVPAVGANGLTSEALLAILIHRTKHLDSQFGCDENKRAIAHMEDALANFEVRTARRLHRWVEGQDVV